MVRSTATVAFNAIEVKGSLLPGSLLDQVAHFKAKQQGPKDYGLEKNARLRDKIDAAWVLVKDLWADYVGLKQRAGQGVAALHFSLRLLREVFEWDDLQPVAGWQRGEANYPITHRAFGGAVPLILKGVATGDLDQGLEQFGPEKNRKRSPHSCLQDCLNADDGANWGLLCSGDRLRLLHDNASLVKPAYLGADLEWLIEGDLFDEFAVLWLTLHASRFRLPVEQGATQNGCVLDGWKREAEDTGERILNQLRGGVESALEHLGNGMLAHQANQDLRLVLESGELSRQAFHEELLRLVYRFLFLFTAEDRELLFAQEVGKEDPRRQIYREGYSLGRLRELALKRSAYEGNYGDLWQLQRLVFQQLSISSSPLGLPGLGGLFDTKQCPNLQVCELDNRYLLRAIKAIGWFEAGGTLTRVNYRDLNTEELGSVYEGLLELHPQVDQVGSRMQLSYGAAAGSDRKTTGSYYTPDALVKLLIESALLPVIQERLSKAQSIEAKIQALLAIRVLDPACGSGHFLLAAGRRLALELARLRAGDDEPSEALRQQCLREVVAHCLYGVDKNPMAVQLCKVALWIEAIDPGKPLSFLDAHIQCGDSLVGVFDPKVLELGIPDEAYKPLTGDDKTVCSSLKKENAAARKTISRGGSNRGIQGSFDLSGTQHRSKGQQALQAIEVMPETNLAETAAKQVAYAHWLADRGHDPETLVSDLYTAAFFLPKTCQSRATAPTTEHLLKLLAGQSIEEEMEEAVVQAAQNFHFFHWHLRFGEVMARGGFDCVLGNPPWEMVSSGKGETADNSTASLQNYFTAEKFAILGGRRDLYKLFLVASRNLIGKSGRAALLTPLGFFTESDSKEARKSMIASRSLSSIYHYQNARKRFFPSVHASYRFCGVVLTGSPADDHKLWTSVNGASSLKESTSISISWQKIDQILGVDGATAIFNSAENYAINMLCVQNIGRLQLQSISVVAEFHATSDKKLILDSAGGGNWKIPKNKDIHVFNPCYAECLTFTAKNQVIKKAKEKNQGLYREIPEQLPRLLFRDIARNDDERCLITVLCPPGYASSYDCPMIVPGTGTGKQEVLNELLFVACWSASYLCDFLIRPYVDKHIKRYTLQRLPWPSSRCLSHAGSAYGINWLKERLVAIQPELDSVYMGQPIIHAKDILTAESPDSLKAIAEINALFFELFFFSGSSLEELKQAVVNANGLEDKDRIEPDWKSKACAISAIMNSF